MHNDAAIVLLKNNVSPVIQVYFEVGPGSCKAKDLARRAAKAAAGWLPELKVDTRAEDWEKAALDTITSGQ